MMIGLRLYHKAPPLAITTEVDKVLTVLMNHVKGHRAYLETTATVWAIDLD